MADELNKDVVGARINLDTTKILPAFKVIDEGARKNAESFKGLNAELTITAKNYAEMAKAADKLVLTSDERRKKILDESNALVTLRTSQAELLQAKTKALDTTNQVVEAKLQAQQSIVKKREDAIEQQEKEHQQRMATLAQKTAAASGQENLIQAKIDRQFQLMKSGDTKLEMEAERHTARMNQLSRTTSGMTDFTGGSAIDSLGQKIKNAATHAVVFHGVYSVINMAQHALKEGLVDIESNMAGYVQTNENYFVSWNKGHTEMVMNTEKLHDETTKFIQTAHGLGAEITDVTESARLWGRMYKDVNVVQELVRQSTKLSTVDLVDLQDATKFMESTLAQYGVQIKNVNDAQVQGGRIMDSWSKVAHETMAPVNDLGAAFERTGKIADEVGVSFDFMNGLISAGVRNTALGGANLGNMWKTVLGNIRTDKAVKEIESLGVATKEVVNGTEQWRKAEDILLDLSIKVIDKNYDLTKSYEDIARGVYQYAKLAASLNVGDILLGESASINSSGSTLEYLKVQMDTIQRKAAQTKASLMEIFNQAGDDGLRSSIKSALDVLDQLLIGITKIPKGVFEATATVAGLIAVYKLVIQPLTLWINAQRALTVAMQLNTVVATEETVAMTALAAGARNAAMMTALATGGITLLVAAIGGSLFMMGSAEKKQNDLTEARNNEIAAMEQQYGQYQRQADFLPKLVSAHNELQKQLDSGTLSEEKQTTVKDQLDKVSRALKDTIGQEGLAQLQAAGYTDQATKAIIESLNARKQALKEDMFNRLTAQDSDLNDQIKQKEEELSKLEDPKNLPGHLREGQQNKINKTKEELEKLKSLLSDIAGKKINVEEDLLKITMAGQDGKAAEADKNYSDRKDAFQQELNGFKHLVSMQEEGYVTAADQIQKLKAIKDKYRPYLTDSDLWSIDEDIYNLSNGKKIGGGSIGSSFSLPLSDIDLQIKQAKSLVDSATSLIEFYNAKRAALSDGVNDSAQLIDLYTNRQEKLKESSEVLSAALAALNAKQASLDQQRKSGKISLDDYNKASEDVTTRIAALTKEIDTNNIAWWNDAKAIKDAKEQQLKDSFDFSEKWIAHEKATREMSAKEEYEAWLRVQARYVQGTELRIKADEEVYRAKKALMQDEEKKLDELVKKEKSQLEESKRAELQKIQDTRDEFVAAQDEKIRAIDRQLQAEQNLNTDQDYEKTLAEKQARAKLLESAVGPQGKKERADLLKEIAKMQEDHNRDLRKRDLESQKQALEDEKREKEAAFERDKKAVESHYDDLLKAFDGYSSDLASAAETLKNLQILKESEKNTEILKNLDTFIAQYQAKMASITSLSRTQAEIDFEKYTENQRIWNDPSSTPQQKQKANEENIAYRDKYGISQTDYIGLQHFDNGGTVKGRRGAPVPVIAHAGEMYLNERQQGNLFRLLDFKMPQINFSMPSFAMASGSNQTIVNHNYYTVSSGDVNLTDDADIQSYWDERDNMVRRFQSRSGAKEK